MRPSVSTGCGKPAVDLLRRILDRLTELLRPGKMGQAELKTIEILGPPLGRHVRHYKLSKNIEKQLIW